LERIGFDPIRIPTFDEINRKLSTLTGWKIIPVDGFIPTKEFFSHIAKREFPCTFWIRDKEHLDFISDPDLFHDFFGHIPSLTNKTFCAFIEKVGKLALKHKDDPEMLEKIGRLWWWTFEFGLIKEDNEVKIFGGGILSSKEEINHSLSDTPTRRQFTVKEAMDTPFDLGDVQHTFFVIDSFEQLRDSINKITEE
jgi:phenylalanine-4-hydroxylase